MIGALARRVTGRPVLVKLACSGATGDVALIRLHRFASFRRAVLGGAIDGCVCLNEEMERELTDWLGPVRTWRMPNGVDVRSFAPPPREERAEMRRRFGFEGRVVLFTGVLRPQKSLPLAVEAISRLPSDVHLWIVGDGPERRRLERFVTGKGLSSRVHLAGSTEDVRPYLHAADAYVLPSTAEGMSNSLLEAMAAGLPAVASDVPGNRDVSGEGRCAALFAPGDVDSLTGALRVLVDDPIRARELARAGQERALAEYDLAGVADRYLAVYRELTNRSRLRGS
jgi:glycosyltransferase involved in cell wall biosynthesis